MTRRPEPLLVSGPRRIAWVSLLGPTGWLVGRRAAGVLGLLRHGSHSCASMGRTPADVRVDERADAELSGVQYVGFLQCDGYITEGLPTLLVQILPDHAGQR